MKAVILARVSTEEQKEAGNSLPAQIARLENYCKQKGFQIVKTHSFDESAYKTKRDDFDKILDYLKSNKEKVVICFDKVDRFSRNVFDKRVSYLYELAMQNKIELHFASDNLIITPNISAVEKFHFGMNLGLAKYYSDAISDNVKRAYEQKLRKSEWPDRAPIGYKNISENDSKEIIPDPERAPFIIKIFELYAQGGYSIKTLSKEIEKLSLRSTKGKVLSSSMIYHILKNPFYYGIMRWNNELYPHKYQTLITHELFEKCQAIRLGWHKKPFKYASKPFIFRGLIKCAVCGCTITPELKKGKYVYYSCTNSKKLHNDRNWIREEELLKPIYDVFEKLQYPDKKINEITEKLKEMNKSKTVFHKQALGSLNKQYTKFQEDLDKLPYLLLDQSITKDIYDKMLKELKEKQYDILSQIEEYTKADENYDITISQVFSLAKKAKEIFECSEITEKRQLLNFLLQNCQLNNKKLDFTLREPFNELVKYAGYIPQLPG